MKETAALPEIYRIITLWMSSIFFFPFVMLFLKFLHKCITAVDLFYFIPINAYL